MVAPTSAVAFATVGYGLARLFRFEGLDAALIGAALIFSSTIIGIKLLPTTVLHHRHLGELMIALLLFQDLLAIIVLVVMESLGGQAGSLSWQSISRPPRLALTRRRQLGQRALPSVHPHQAL